MFDALVDKKVITKVDLVDFYNANPTELEKLTVEEMIADGIATEISTNNYILPDFSKGGPIKLENDLYITYPIIIEKDTEIDLNGFNIINDTIFVDESDGSTNCYVFWVKKNKLVIKGEGTVRAIGKSTYDIAVWANGGTVDIYGGHFISGGTEGNGCDCIYSSAGGRVNIYDGKFECLHINNVSFASPQYGVLNEKGNNQNTINCFGGQYVKFNPSDNISENPKKDFCAKGYKSIMIENDLWEVVKNEEDIVVEEA